VDNGLLNDVDLAIAAFASALSLRGLLNNLGRGSLSDHLEILLGGFDELLSLLEHLATLALVEGPGDTGALASDDLLVPVVGTVLRADRRSVLSAPPASSAVPGVALASRVLGAVSVDGVMGLESALEIVASKAIVADSLDVRGLAVLTAVHLNSQLSEAHSSSSSVTAFGS